MCVLVPHPILDYTLFMLSPQYNHIILNIDVIIRLHFFFRLNSFPPPALTNFNHPNSRFNSNITKNTILRSKVHLPESPSQQLSKPIQSIKTKKGHFYFLKFCDSFVFSNRILKRHQKQL